MRRRLLLLHCLNGTIIVCMLTWLGAQAGMTSGTLAAAAAALSQQPALAPAMLPAGPAPLPNHVVRSLAANTNPNVPLGGWTTYSTTNSSISGNDATSIALDADGHPWVGHPVFSPGGGGLSAFNGGVGWTNYYSPTLVNNWVTAVAVDGRNQVWAGSPTYYNINIGAIFVGGVALRNTVGAWSKYLIGTSVTSIAAAGSEVWIGTGSGGVARFDASTDPPTLLSTFTVTTTSGGLASDNILTIVVAEMTDPYCGTQPRFYVGHDAGVSIYEYRVVGIFPITCGWAWTTYSSPSSSLPSTSITAIAVDTRKRVWFGSNCCDTGIGSANGLSMLDGSTWVTYTVDNSGLTYSRTATLAADAQGRVWIGQTDFTGGISAPQRRPSGPAPDTLPAQVMLNVFEDGGSSARSDDRWCTYYAGGGSCASPSITAGLPSNHVSAIAAARERIWFGTGDVFYGAGVATLQLNWQTFNTNSGMNANAVQALLTDNNTNELWVGGPNGVNRFDGSNWTFYPLATGGYFSSGIRALHRDAAGRLWAGEGLINGPSYGAVWLYLPNSNTWQPYLAPGTGTINALSSDALGQNSRLWIATSEALKVFNVRTSAWVTFTTGNSPLVSNNVKAITRDHADWMWLGTDGGLSVYTGTGWLSYTVASTAGGLVSDNVRALAGDGLGRMWVGTAAGVSVISGTTWTAYTVANTGGGLRSNFVQGIALDAAGRVWVATDNGLSMFDGARWAWLNRYTSGLVDDDLRAIAADNQDGVWIGTPQGLGVRGAMPSVIALPAPVIDSVSPSSGPMNTSVSIIGVNFAGGLETNRVYFSGPGGTYAEAQIQQRSSNGSVSTLMVRVPFNAVKGPIYVSTGGGTAVSANDFSPLPTVSSGGVLAGGPGVILGMWGANLGGATSRIRFANNVEAFSLEPMNSDRIKVRIPANAVSGPLTVVTEGGLVQLTGPFTLANVCPLKNDNTCAASGDGCDRSQPGPARRHVSTRGGQGDAGAYLCRQQHHVRPRAARLCRADHHRR